MCAPYVGQREIFTSPRSQFLLLYPGDRLYGPPQGRWFIYAKDAAAVHPLRRFSCISHLAGRFIFLGLHLPTFPTAAHTIQAWENRKTPPALAHKAGPPVQETSLLSFQPLKAPQG